MTTIAKCKNYRIDAERLSLGTCEYRYTLWGPNIGNVTVRLLRFQTLHGALGNLEWRAKGAPIELFTAALDAD